MEWVSVDFSFRWSQLVRVKWSLNKTKIQCYVVRKKVFTKIFASSQPNFESNNTCFGALRCCIAIFWIGTNWLFVQWETQKHLCPQKTHLCLMGPCPPKPPTAWCPRARADTRCTWNIIIFCFINTSWFLPVLWEYLDIYVNGSKQIMIAVHVNPDLHKCCSFISLLGWTSQEICRWGNSASSWWHKWA